MDIKSSDIISVPMYAYNVLSCISVEKKHRSEYSKLFMVFFFNMNILSL